MAAVVLLRARLLALALMALFTGIFSVLAVLRYQVYHPFSQDFAYRLQGFWHFLHYGSFRETIYGGDLLRFHFEPIIYAFMPLFRLTGESPEVIIVLQVFMVALSGLPLFAAACRWLSPRAAVAVLLAYYLYPPLQFGAVFYFSPIVLGAVFVNAALYALLVRGSMRGAVLMLLAAALCQEVYFYVAGVVGIVWWCQGHWRSGVALALAGGLAMVLYFANYSPATPEFPYFMSQHEIVARGYGNLSAQPAALAAHAAQILRPLSAEYLLRLAGPLAFLPFLAPRLLVPLLVILLPLCLAQFDFSRQIYTYYQFIPLPFVWWAFLLAFRRRQNIIRVGAWSGRKVLLALVLALSVAASLYESPLAVWHRPLIYYPGIYENPRRAVIDAALARVPDGASVLALPVLSDKLFRRQRLEVIFKENILDPGVEYILMDLREFNWVVDIEWPFVPAWLQSMKELVATGRYRLDYYAQGIMVLRRNDAGALPTVLPPELQADFAAAFARAFAVLGTDCRVRREPFISAQANDWPGIYHVYGSGTVRLPVIAGGFGVPGLPDFDRLDLVRADSPTTVLRQWGRTDVFILSVPLDSLPEGGNRVLLRGWRGGRVVDTAVVTLRRDVTPPELRVFADGVRRGEYRLLAVDESSPVEVWLTTATGRERLTPPLIHKWLGMELMDNCPPVPGGVARWEQALTVADTAAVEVLDYAGNCRRVILAGVE